MADERICRSSAPPKVNREPYVWFRTKDLNFTGTNPLSCGRAHLGGGLWLQVERQRIPITRKNA